MPKKTSSGTADRRTGQKLSLTLSNYLRSGELYGVAARQGEAWVVGRSEPAQPGNDFHLAEGWLKAWPAFKYSGFSGPQARGTLQGVAQVPGNAQVPGTWWTVGYEYRFFPPFNSPKMRTHTRRRIGQGNWTIVPSPNVDLTFDNTGKADNRLRAVASASAGHAWAVGDYCDYLGLFGAGSRSLILSWDGSTWGISPTQPIGAEDRLYGVAAVSASNAWAVGVYSDHYKDYALIQHWDGSAWNIVTSPDRPALSISLSAVCAISARDLWAVGKFTKNGTNFQPLILHGDGSSWTVVPVPGQGELYGVSGVGANDVWAVGWKTGYGLAKPLILHWDGKGWSAVPNPVFQNITELNAVTAVTTSDVWAAGNKWNGTTNQSLVEHWDGNAWSVFPSP
jgi:hypothetical protein